MSVTKTNQLSKCSHSEIALGPRGANCLNCNCFLYSQKDNYKDCKSVIATLNVPEELKTPDIVPYEYYCSLLKEERAETDARPYNFCATTLGIRKKLIDYVIELGDRFKQRNLTIHIAVVYLDLALHKYSDILVNRSLETDSTESNRDHANLWAIVSLMLASKYDELDRRIPFYKDIINASSRAAKYSVKEFHVVEDFFIQNVLQWKFHLITTLHFSY